MTVAPHYPLERSHLGDDNPEELVPSRFGVMERWRALAMQTGELGALTALRDRVKNDAISAVDEIEQRERVVTERERASDARERLSDAREASLLAATKTLNDAVDRFAELQTRADQEPEPQARPPGATSDAPSPADPSFPNTPAEPPPGASTTDELHAYASDLPDLPDKQAPAVERDARGEFLRRVGDAEPNPGGTPVSVPLSYVHSRDQAEFSDPTLAKPPVVQQPIAAGLD